MDIKRRSSLEPRTFLELSISPTLPGEGETKGWRHGCVSPPQGSHGVSISGFTWSRLAKHTKSNHLNLLFFHAMASLSHPFPPAKCHRKGHRAFLHDSVIFLKYVFPDSTSLRLHKTQEYSPSWHKAAAHMVLMPQGQRSGSSWVCLQVWPRAGAQGSVMNEGTVELSSLRGQEALQCQTSLSDILEDC